MNKTALILAAAAASLLVAPATVGAKAKLTPQQRLDKMLEGRTAGKPVSCISLLDTRDMTILDKTALVYKSGSTLWVNRPKNPESLDSDDIMVTHPTGSQLCKLDIVRMHDRNAHFFSGSIFLGDFVPYRKVQTAKAD